MAPEQPVRVRIAPSPTGYLHLGTVRTALFNYLFARKEKGSFVIRIEDTDHSRSLPLYERDILDGLKAMGLVWDEGPDIGGSYGPYRQSERTDIYKKYVRRLISEGKAYKCFCLKEQLEEERKAMIAQGLAPKYSGTCRNLTPEQIDAYEKEGKESVLRLKVPFDYIIEFNDLIRGKISVHSGIIGDFIIARNESSPLYNLAVVIDDREMNISHVIRGEDHISNTPKQILIQQALGFPEPKYAHLPLILSPDRSKLSKRSLETSFVEYLKEGYLPQALLNFIALLGWHDEGNEELFSLDELVKKFSFKRVQKAGAVFNEEKLRWFNSQYIQRSTVEELAGSMEQFVPEQWLKKKELFHAALAIEKNRMEKLSEFEDLARFFFEQPPYDTELLRWQDVPLEKIRTHLEEVRKMLLAGQDIMPYAEQEGRGEVLWPVRVALSGLKNSPNPFEIMSALGKEESIRRIEAAIQKIHDTAHA